MKKQFKEPLGSAASRTQRENGDRYERWSKEKEVERKKGGLGENWDGGTMGDRCKRKRRVTEERKIKMRIEVRLGQYDGVNHAAVEICPLLDILQYCYKEAFLL